MNHPFSVNEMAPMSRGEGAVVAPPERVDAFVRLLGQNQRRLDVYVMSLVSN